MYKWLDVGVSNLHNIKLYEKKKKKALPNLKLLSQVCAHRQSQINYFLLSFSDQQPPTSYLNTRTQECSACPHQTPDCTFCYWCVIHFPCENRKHDGVHSFFYKHVRVIPSQVYELLLDQNCILDSAISVYV